LPFILHIDTAFDLATVCLSIDEQVLAKKENRVQNDHASFVHNAIKQLMEQEQKVLKDIDAVAVTAGPGSYTGLRVGMATAKGLCYALTKPLLILNTLEVLTRAAIENEDISPGVLMCPMIDARRMEVYTALYNPQMSAVLSPCAMILDQLSFKEWLDSNTILFFGNGSDKFKSILDNTNARFAMVSYNAKHLVHVANNAYHKNQFANLAYAEPLYIKEVYTK